MKVIGKTIELGVKMLVFRRVLAASAILTMLSWPQAASAATLLEAYSAYIGSDDLSNSRGERLRQPWQIIRQDRANFHRFGISQRGDTGDGFFSSADNRALAEQMIRRGTITPAARQLILQGDALLHVQIYRGAGGDYIDITVQ